MKHEIFNSIVALLGLAIAGVTAWHQFYPAIFPSSRTVAAVSTTQWTIDEGRLGRGPRLLARVSFSNLGSEAVTIQSMQVKYALGSNDSKNIGCRNNKFTWVGIPWGTFLRGEKLEPAISIIVAPNIPVTEVVSFEAANVLPDSGNKNDKTGSVFACMQIDTLDAKLKIISVWHPIGTITYSEKSIVDFSMDEIARDSFTVRE